MAADASARVRKTVTMLFCDVVGSTSLGESLDPELLREVMERYFAEMRTCIERHGGTVEKFIGDAVMAVFGVPHTHEDDALRAVRAAVEMRETLQGLNKEFERDQGIQLQVRIGVNTGEVVAGDATTGQGLVTGDAVNTAARLEQHARPDEVLLGETTYRLVRNAVSAEPAAPVSAKGKAEPISAFRLIDVASDDGRWAPYPHRFVGRSEDLEALRSDFAAATNDHTCRLVTVVGEAGVGKSRLIREFVTSCVESAVPQGRCLPYGDGITFWPIAEIVTQVAGILDVDLPDDVRLKIARACAGDADADAIAERVAHVLGVTASLADAAEVFWAIRRFLEAIASQAPLVVVIEDLHWAEPLLLDLIESMTTWISDAPVFLVATARPELLEGRPTWSAGISGSSVLSLQPLTQEETDALVGELLRDLPISPEALPRIASLCEGNPLFAEQLVATLRDRHGEVEHAELEPAELDVPSSIAALLDARLDGLPDAERALLERGAIEGRVFHVGDVVAMTRAEDRSEISSDLLSLVRRGLVQRDRSAFSGDHAFRFSHILVRDAAERRIPKASAAELHERCADWMLRSAAEGRAAELDAIVGYHLERAVQLRRLVRPTDEGLARLAARAADRLAAAGMAATYRGDPAAGSGLLRRAVELRDQDDPQLLRDIDELALADDARGRLDDALEGWNRLLAEAERRGDRVAGALARCRLTFLGSSMQPHRWTFSDLRDEAERAMAIFAEHDDHERLAQSWRHVGLAEWGVAMYNRARAAFDRAGAEADLAGRHVDALFCRCEALAAGFFGSLTPAEGLPLCGLLTSEPQLQRRLLAATLSIRASYLAMQGEFERARELSDRACSMAEEISSPAITTNLQFRADIELLAGAPEAAEPLRRRAARLTEETGDVGHASTQLANHAAILCELGRSEEALAEAERAMRMSEAGDIATQAEAWRAIARALAAEGRLSEAADAASEAVVLTEDIEWPDLQAVIRIDAAPILSRTGRQDDAIRLATDAVHLCERKGNIVRLERARAVLEEMTSS